VSQAKDAAGLARVVAALEALTDAELHALRKSSNGARQIAPDLLLWLEGACDWDWNRRLGSYHKLLPPTPSIDPSKDEIGITAAHAMRVTLAASGSAPEVLQVFDALLSLLNRSERKL